MLVLDCGQALGQQRTLYGADQPYRTPRQVIAETQGVTVLPIRKPILPCRQTVGFQVRPAERRFCGR
jgi:hypothetical protein